MAEEDLDPLIGTWAARRAPELIARAQADALDAARRRLQERLVDALLEAADDQLAGTARPAPPPREERRPSVPARPRQDTGSVLWVYGVVEGASAEPPAAEGVDGHPVRLHRHAGVSALVSEVPLDRFSEETLKERLEELDGLEVLARAHEAILQAAMARGPVVPFRLCTIYSSPERLVAMLDAEGRELAATLRRLAGAEEWGVKAFSGTPAAVAAGEPPSASESGTDYLSRKRERREAEEAGRDAIDAAVAGIHARLAESAAAAVLSRPHDRRLSGRPAEMVLNASYLVPSGGVDAFRSVVEQLARRHEPEGVELELTGPWPPYHFVETPGHDGHA